MIDLATGELAPLYGTATVACGNRREAVCPACSQVYKRDARQLVRAGLAGGKGIPETITAHPCVFATLTAPSFGPVHARRLRGKTVLPCRPRRDANARRCPHGRDISCPTRHVETDPRLGQPMCPRLLRLRSCRAVQRLRGRPVAPVRHLPAPPPGPAGRGHPEDPARPAPHPVRQGRRIPGARRGPLPRRHPPRRARRGLPAARRPAYTADLLCDAIDQAAAAVRIVIDHDGQAVTLGFGPQTDTRIIRHGADLPGTGQALNGQAVANYIAKYATKTLTAPGVPSPAAPPRGRHRAPALLGPLPADDHHRLAARRHPAPAPGSGPGRTCSATAATS